MITNILIHKTKEAPASFSLSFEEFTPKWTMLHEVAQYRKQIAIKKRMTAKDWIDGRYYYTLIPNLSLEDLESIRCAIDNQINNLHGQKEETKTGTTKRTKRVRDK